MGLFDEVRCEYRLPDPAHQGLVFQTKELESALEDLLLLLLTSIGLRRAAEVVGPKLWRSAAAPERWTTGRPKARRGSRPKS